VHWKAAGALDDALEAGAEVSTGAGVPPHAASIMLAATRTESNTNKRLDISYSSEGLSNLDPVNLFDGWLVWLTMHCNVTITSFRQNLLYLTYTESRRNLPGNGFSSGSYTRTKSSHLIK
jgi:hypothetical protein